MKRVYLFPLALLLACGPVGTAGQQPGRETQHETAPGPVVPVPIAGGDFYAAAPHHAAGIIHQFTPGPQFDGLDAEPNEMTNFNGTVALVYTGGTISDAAGNPVFIVDVDMRVYQGEYIGADGRHAYGTFCEF